MKLTILICGSFRQISSIYFITCFVFVAWFYTLVLVLHIQFHIVISTCFFYCNFLLFLVVVTTTLIFRLCPNNILNILVIYNSSWLPNLVSLIFSLFVFSFCFDFASPCKYIYIFFTFLFLFCFVCFIFLFCLFGLFYAIMWFFTYARFNLTSVLSTQVLQAVVNFLICKYSAELIWPK